MPQDKSIAMAAVVMLSIIMLPCALLTLLFWIPLYLLVDERVTSSVSAAKDGQGENVRVFDKGDCQNPCRGFCKVSVLVCGC
jgi:hypothetical protein